MVIPSHKLLIYLIQATISLSLEYNAPTSSKNGSGKDSSENGGIESDAIDPTGGVGDEEYEELENNEEGDEENQDGDVAVVGGAGRPRQV